MNWFDEQIQLRKMSDQEVFEASFVRMAGAVLGRKIATALNDDRIQTKNAIEEILRFYHIKCPELPENLTDRNEQLEYLMRPYGIMRRTVKLTEGWYKDAYGPMLAVRKDDGTVAALMPAQLRGYYFLDPATGKRVKVNSKTAGLFDMEAICFYKPFPLKALKIPDLLIYMLRTISNADWFYIILCTLLITGIGFLAADQTKKLYEDVLLSSSYQVLIAMAIYMIGTGISKLMITTVKELYYRRTQSKMSLFVGAASMMRVLSLPASFFKQFSAGELSARVEYIKRLCTSMASLILSTGLTAVFSLAYIGQIFSYAPGLVIPALLVTGATVVLSIVTMLLQTRVTRLQMENSTKENGINYAMLTGVQKIKLAGAEKRAFARWAEQYARVSELEYNPPTLLKLGSVLTKAISLAGTIVIYYYSLKTGISVGDYGAFNVSYGMVSGAFMSLAGIASTVAGIKPILDMVKPILEAVPEVSEGKKVIQSLKGRIELSNVSFRYSDNMPMILNNINLRIHAGDYVAIVGETGCGKSTLIRLLLGFELPRLGAVYYDGKDITTIDLRSLRRRIGVVMQNGQLFTGSIYDNIVISAPWLTLDDAWEAARIAGLDEDIRRMPMGMQTIISEGSGGISGGQKQRMMIARAVAPKPKVLIFDEATSALDNVTQKKVSEALDSLKCTRIVVAHRLSTIRQCNRILFLKNGVIAEEGTYEKLIEKGGLFAELVERQRLDR